jgi:hypothetical protein
MLDLTVLDTAPEKWEGTEGFVQENTVEKYIV